MAITSFSGYINIVFFLYYYLLSCVLNNTHGFGFFVPAYRTAGRFRNKPHGNHRPAVYDFRGSVQYFPVNYAPDSIISHSIKYYNKLL